MKKILIIKTSAIGDVIQTLGAVQSLKALYPDCQIDWVCEQGVAPLLKEVPFLSKLFIIDTKKWKKHLLTFSSYQEIFLLMKSLRKESYDVLFDLQGNTKSGVFTFFAKAVHKVGFDKSLVAEWPNLLTTNVKISLDPFLNAYKTYEQLIFKFLGQDKQESGSFSFSLEEKEKKRVQECFELAQSPLVVVGFGSNWENKKLSASFWNAFLKDIQEKEKITFVVPYLKEDEEELNVLKKGLLCVAIPDLSLAGCFALMRAAKAYIGVDSALLHLAQLSSLPSFGIFGPSSSQYYVKTEGKNASFQGACPYGVQFEKRCPKLRFCHQAPCMKGVSQEKLLPSFWQFWQAL